ncbi:insulinase family protein [Clostridium sp. AM58-1XD]|uniref:insulinase family protein n=1 Tax=Clostridium sp. AM58-1XD TaxID=2292307 RepID=UPI000E4F8BEF|nr:insulinase family protein [Clostridium sp. AM58-1XD]RGY96731.1 hypothetical protein DXA13_16375 [Clostridium sp. AM58-1XD]
MKKYDRLQAILTAAVLLTAVAGCSEEQKETQMNSSVSNMALEEAETDSFEEEELSQYDVIAGFEVMELGEIEEVGAETILFYHEQSGAELLYIKNDDKELGFSIAYRTPSMDETDMNHILKHVVLASSEKYPSTNLYSDMKNRGFITYMNAETHPAVTYYPVCSQSEEQLMKAADVYLSCMTSPEFLINENIYKREAFRCELENEKAQITAEGGVFHEDMENLTDMEANARGNVGKALYPELAAQNAEGMLYKSYKEITYDKVKEAYESMYHFDNSLIILYGDLDYQRFLRFLDQEYLSAEEDNGTDFSGAMNEEVPGGYTEQTAEIPAYEESSAEQASVICYAMDLSKSSWEDIMRWELFSAMLNSENSPLERRGKENGISGRIELKVVMETAKPYLAFYLNNTDPDKKDAFKATVLGAMEEVSERGIDEEIFQSVLKSSEMEAYLARNAPSAAAGLFNTLSVYWSNTGRTDYYSIKRSCMNQIKANRSQMYFKELAKQALAPSRSALVVNVPVPGLAEKKKRELEEDMAGRKVQMTGKEIRQLVSDTAEFRQWSEKERVNADFLIPLSGLMAKAETADFSTKKIGELTSCTAAVSMEKVGACSIYFDLSEIPEEDIFYLPIYQLLISRLDGNLRESGELRALSDQYLYQMSFRELLIEEGSSGNRPVMEVNWYCMTKDYETSLKLLMELMMQTKFDDPQKTTELLREYLSRTDQQGYDQPTKLMDTAVSFAESYMGNNRTLDQLFHGQDSYHFMKTTLRRLQEEPEYSVEFADKMKEISRILLNKKDIISVIIADQNELEEMEQTAGRMLGALMSHERVSQKWEGLSLSGWPKRTGICTAASEACTALVSSYGKEDGSDGRYAAFLKAAEEGYIVPGLEAEAGQNCAGLYMITETGQFCLYRLDDPNVKESLEVFDGVGDYLRHAKISQEDFDGYILSAYAEATRPSGIFHEKQQSIERYLQGIDEYAVAERIRLIKEASLEDQDEAAQAIEEQIRNGSAAAVGKGSIIEEGKACFDVLLDWGDSSSD